MKTIRFGIVGAGMMGREFASAVARWCHMLDVDLRPEIVAVATRSASPFDWFRAHFPSIKQYTHDYHELIANDEVDAIYAPVPHHLHKEVCCAALAARKHLLAEKPLGIDLTANAAILNAWKQCPDVLLRVASQWAFFPGAQRVCDAIEHGAFGRIIEVNTGFLHSGDLDPNRPMNWKRQIEFNGEYGVLGDLGIHACFIPFRAGWLPRNVRAILSKIVSERPNANGGRSPCLTWDNATLLCETRDNSDGTHFPLTLRAHRIAPGERNSWYIEVYGTRASARFSTRDPKALEWLEYTGGEQIWGRIQTGYETAFRTITGPNFEFGATDALLQMIAAFLVELVRGAPPRKFAGCMRPEETAVAHRLFTAALKSHANSTVELVEA
ncbi:MAG: Gfo/Idh/MocA family oxidoreductase [Verrucomicrobiota bacterium]|nr:Gfo/Idh/MocA family oxidoreductase [Verrucomicrobiota bacterium]